MNGRERTALIPVLWKKGKEVSEICEELGYKCEKHVVKVLKQLGLYVNKRVDVAKVHALRKAGWHMAEILYELGQKYTAKQVIEAVNEYDRRHKHEGS